METCECFRGIDEEMCRGCDVEGQQHLAAKILMSIPTAILCMHGPTDSLWAFAFLHLSSFLEG